MRTFLICTAIAMIPFLFGIANLFGKGGSIYDAINHATGAWDGFILERGHFILKGLQSIGIAIGMELLFINKCFVNQSWLDYLSLAIILISGLLIFNLEAKLYVNKS